MAAGYRGGFNPFRDSRGRWGTAATHAGGGSGAEGTTGPDHINAAIRQAAGRAPARSVPDGFESLITPHRLAYMDNTRSHYAPGATTNPYNEYATVRAAAEKAVAAPESERKAASAALTSALHSAGIMDPGLRNATRHDLLDLMDKIEQAPGENERRLRTLHGATIASTMADPKLATAFLDAADTPGRLPGVRAELERTAGPAPLATGYARRAQGKGVDLSIPLSPRNRASSIGTASQLNETSGPYKGKTIAQIHEVDPAYLRNLAYDGSMMGSHIGNYLHALDELG